MCYSFQRVIDIALFSSPTVKGIRCGADFKIVTTYTTKRLLSNQDMLKKVSATSFEQVIKCFIACGIHTRPYLTHINTKQHVLFPIFHLFIFASFYWCVFSAAWLQICSGL